MWNVLVAHSQEKKKLLMCRALTIHINISLSFFPIFQVLRIFNPFFCVGGWMGMCLYSPTVVDFESTLV